MPRRVALAAAAGVALLAAVLVARTLSLPSRQPPAEAADLVAVDADAAAERLAGAIRIPTVSEREGQDVADPAAFRALHAFLERSFPAAHRALAREAAGAGGLSLLYEWVGSDPALEPVLLLAHMDVVPVEPGTEGRWTHPPFEGRIADGFVWGRGALDDKASLAAILEAVEALLARGFRPRRSVWLAFGHDEEIGGRGGAAEVAKLLESRGLRFAWALDEGSLVVRDVPGFPAPAALVGIAEKGYVSVALEARGEPGHSSMPPPETAIGIVARAVHALERRPRPAALGGPARALFEHVGPEMPFARRLVVANLWLFGPLVERTLAANRATNALIRTTTAATIIEGGVKENVLPSRARAVVNFRILPGETVAGVIEHVRRTVADPRVEVSIVEGLASEPSLVSSAASDGFRAIGRAARQVFSGALVAPSLVVAATDARHYARVARDVYRFVPIEATQADLERVHGTDERISVEGHARAIRFYAQLLRIGAGGE